MSTQSVRQTFTKVATTVAATAALAGGLLVATVGSAGAVATASSKDRSAGANIIDVQSGRGPWRASTTPVPSKPAETTARFYCNPCLITQVGPGDTSPDIPVRLMDPQGQFLGERWFVAKGNQAYMLQAALAAITTGRHVNVQLADSFEYSNIINLYVLDH